MPSKIVNELKQQIEELRRIMDAHLAEGVGVKNDIKWLKWLNMSIATAVIFRLLFDWLKGA